MWMHLRALHQNPATCLGRDVNRANLATGLTLCLLLSLFGHKPMGLLGLARINLNLGPRLPFLVGASNKRNIISIISFQSVKEQFVPQLGTALSSNQSICLSLQNKSLPAKSGALLGVDYTSLMKESRGLYNSKGFLVDKSTDVLLGQTGEVPIPSTTITS